MSSAEFLKSPFKVKLIEISETAKIAHHFE